MNKNIALPISGLPAKKNSRFKSFKYKPFFEIEKDRQIESKKWFYIVEFFCVFLYFYLYHCCCLQFSVMQLQFSIWMAIQRTKRYVYLTVPLIENSNFSLTNNVYFKNFNPNWQQINPTKIEKDKN